MLAEWWNVDTVDSRSAVLRGVRVQVSPQLLWRCRTVVSLLGFQPGDPSSILGSVTNFFVGDLIKEVYGSLCQLSQRASPF